MNQDQIESDLLFFWDEYLARIMDVENSQWDPDAGNFSEFIRRILGDDIADAYHEYAEEENE